jgi:hypothetical protein
VVFFFGKQMEVRNKVKVKEKVKIGDKHTNKHIER